MDGRGYFSLGRWRGIPICLHWSAPLGAFLWTGGEVSVVRIAGFLAMILFHEMGHAVLVRRARAHVVKITMHIMGGECWWRGEATPIERAAIAFGGVWAQLLLAAAAFAFAAFAPAEMMTPRMGELVNMWTRWNLFNAAFNLIPVKPLDGSEAWRLFPLLWKRARRGRLQRQQSRNKRELKQVESELKELLERARKGTSDGKPRDRSSLS